MTTCERGDVVLVGFVFSDQSARKLRPAIVLSSAAYQRSPHEVIVAAVTSNVKRRLVGDCVLSRWREAGLLYPSVVTGILRTVKRETLERRLGSLAAPDLETVGQELRRSLGL